MCQSGEATRIPERPLIDTTLRFETPEGVELEVVPAGPVARGLAFLTDSAIRYGALFALSIPIGILGEFGQGLLLLLWFLFEWFYPVLFEVLGSGQTPGKRFLGLRTVNLDATPVGFGASLTRNLLRVADFLPLFYCAGVISMLVTGRFQRLGDLAAGTLVVYDGADTGKMSAGDPERRRVEGSRPAPLALRPDEQLAVLGFSERRGGLSEPRAIELAEILTPLTGVTGTECCDEIERIANGIAGRR